MFGILAGGDPFNLEPQGAHETVIAFAPNAEGEYRAVLKIASNDPDEGVVEVPLIGTAIVLAPDITADADTLDFGEVAVGDHSERTLTIANQGNQVLNIWSVSVVFDELGFEIVSGGGQRQVMPDSSFQIVVRFTPNMEREFTNILTVSSDDEDTPTLEIALMGVSPLSVNGGSAGPVEFGLGRISPNPFNSRTMVDYGLRVPGTVSLRLYDTGGRLVRTLVNEREAAGRHTVTIDAAGLGSGVYLLKLTAGRDAAVRKVVCVK